MVRDRCSRTGPERDVQRACGEAVDRIALDLVREALWDGDRCTWIGADWDPDTPAGTASYFVFGPTLHGGALGVGLFLAEAARRSVDRRIMETAIGAFRQGVSSYRTVPADEANGLYIGWGSVA